MAKRWLYVIPFMVACQPAVNSRPLPVAIPDRIIGRDAWLDLTTVPERLRLPQMPVAGGYYVLYAASGRFCVVDRADWSAGPNDGQFHSCEWRWPRGPR